MKITIVFFIVFVFIANSSNAFLGNIHKRIAETAIVQKQSLLTDNIKTIGYESGINEYFGFMGVDLILIDASVTEDDGTRAQNHFYNPLNGSGFRTYDVASNYSSFVWANHDLYNDWSWGKARNSFYLGLTATSDSERRSELANSFRALGQVMHLVQDLAVPAHVRNDAHPPPAGDGFETYTSANVDSLNYVPTAFSGPKNSLTEYAPRQLWDSDQYDGSNPTTNTAIGLAEYTNANFGSEDTIFTENNLTDWNPLNDNLYFPYPRRQDTAVFTESQNKFWNGFEVYRKYFEKNGGGQPIKHFATASRLYAYLLDDPSPSLQGFDDQCHKDYAELLIPRAVGYSAALLDYFFRGQIDMAADTGNPSQYLIKNEADEELSGAFALYYDDKTGNRKPVAGAEWSLSIAAKGSSNPVSFTSPDDAREAGKYILVFQGRMGQEEGAVVGKVLEVDAGIPFLIKIQAPELIYASVIYWDVNKNELYKIFDKNTGSEITQPVKESQALFKSSDPYIHGNFTALPMLPDGEIPSSNELVFGDGWWLGSVKGKDHYSSKYTYEEDFSRLQNESCDELDSYNISINKNECALEYCSVYTIDGKRSLMWDGTENGFRFNSKKQLCGQSGCQSDSGLNDNELNVKLYYNLTDDSRYFQKNDPAQYQFNYDKCDSMCPQYGTALWSECICYANWEFPLSNSRINHTSYEYLLSLGKKKLYLPNLSQPRYIWLEKGANLSQSRNEEGLKINSVFQETVNNVINGRVYWRYHTIIDDQPYINENADLQSTYSRTISWVHDAKPYTIDKTTGSSPVIWGENKSRMITYKGKAIIWEIFHLEKAKLFPYKTSIYNGFYLGSYTNPSLPDNVKSENKPEHTYFFNIYVQNSRTCEEGKGEAGCNYSWDAFQKIEGKKIQEAFQGANGWQNGKVISLVPYLLVQ